MSNIKKLEKLTTQLEFPGLLQFADESIKYSIYRSIDPMSNQGLMEKATKIGEVMHPETSFLDIGLDSSQTVYYGVTVTIQEKNLLL